MKLHPQSVFILLATLILILSNCNSESTKNKSSFTMAKDSELTPLMRDMETYYEGIKSKIESNTLDEEVRSFPEIHTAKATAPEKISNELYQGLSSIYVNSAKRLNRANVNKRDAFNLMVDNCMSCHQQMCPGPMVRIKKLYLD